MTKNLFLYHSQHTPPAFTFQKRASPGIEPGPPAPKAGILPLNYKAFLLLYHVTRYYLRRPLRYILLFICLYERERETVRDCLRESVPDFV